MIPFTGVPLLFISSGGSSLMGYLYGDWFIATVYFTNTSKGDECLMRIVAGKYGSRPLKSCKGDTTRPTADKVKGAVFPALEVLLILEECWIVTAAQAIWL